MIASNRVQDERAKACRSCPFFHRGTDSCGTPLPKKLVKGQAADFAETERVEEWLESHPFDEKARDTLEYLQQRKRRPRLCGCYMRKKWALKFASCSLPKPIRRWDKTFTDEDLAKAKEIVEGFDGSFEDRDAMHEIYAKLFNKRKGEVNSCGKCYKNMVNEINQLIKGYESE